MNSQQKNMLAHELNVLTEQITTAMQNGIARINNIIDNVPDEPTLFMKLKAMLSDPAHRMRTVSTLIECTGLTREQIINLLEEHQEIYAIRHRIRDGAELIELVR